MLRPLSILLLLLTCAPWAWAGDALTEIARQEQWGFNFRTQAYRNAALRQLLPDSSLSSLALGGRLVPVSVARVPQLGDGARSLQVEATSMQRLGKTDCVWGKAGYRGGVTRHVKWNETSDFLLLYPYVMGDEKGGDLTHEQYDLWGGYSCVKGKMHWGATMGYRAVSEFRERDPRPANTVAHLRASVAVGVELLGRYALATSVKAGRYKQTNELLFMNELGAEKEYHFTGLGNEYVRFSGASNKAFYKLSQWGTSIELLPLQASGLSVSASYEHGAMEKVLTELNRLPLNSLTTHDTRLELAWQKPSMGVKWQGQYMSKTGHDNLFGDATGNVYPFIGSRKQYCESNLWLRLCGFYEGNDALPCKWTWGLKPHLDFMMHKSRHHDSGNSMASAHFTCGLDARASLSGKKNRLSALGSIARRNALSHELVLNRAATPQVGSMLQAIDHRASCDEWTMRLMVRGDLDVWAGKVISAQLGWQHGIFLKNVHFNEYEIKILFTL